ANALVTASSALTTSLCGAVCARMTAIGATPAISATANNLFMTPPVRLRTLASVLSLKPEAIQSQMSAVLDRFLRYVQYDTQSDETSATYPSTSKQLVLLNDLADELRGLGLTDAAIDDHGYVTAMIPSTSRKHVPAIAFI